MNTKHSTSQRGQPRPRACTRKLSGPILLLLLCLGMCLAVTQALAQTAISVNYNRANAGAALAATDTAGDVPVQNWNNLVYGVNGSFNAPTITFVDSTGTAVAGFDAQYSLNNVNSWNTAGTPDQKLFGDWADGAGTLTLSGIPYATYDLYVYFDGFCDNVVSYTIGADTETLDNGADSPGTFTSYIRGENYVVFVGLTGSSQSMVVSGGGCVRGVCAFQIVSPSATASTFTITPSAGTGGTISPNTPQTVAGGTQPVFTIAPNAGFVIDQVQVDGVNNEDAAGRGTYTFPAVRAGHTIAATFAPTPSGGTGIISVNYDTPSSTAPLAATDVAGVTTPINVAAANWNNIYGYNNILKGNGAGGILAPVRAFYDNNGATVAPFTVTLSAGGMASWNTAGTPDQRVFGDYVYGLGGGTVTFSGIPYATYDLYVYSDPIGGGTWTCTIGADTETFNCSIGSPGAGGFGYVLGNDYVVFRGLSGSSQTMTVTGSPGSLAGFQIASPAAVLHTITASADANSTISPSGAVTVVDGQNQTFTISANLGYIITHVYVDSVDQGPLTSYTFNSVTANHTISVTSGVAPTYSISGTVKTNGVGAGGASVYISTTPSASASPAFTATTAGDGTYTQTVPAGTYYVAAGDTGYWTSGDQQVVVSGASTANFALNPNTRNIPSQSTLWFSAVTESLPTSGPTGNWPSYLPAGNSFNPVGGPVPPTATNVDNSIWEQNLISSADGLEYYDASLVGAPQYTTPIAANGATITAVVTPKVGVAGSWNTVVSIFNLQLFLGVESDNQALWVAVPGFTGSGPAVAANQPVVLSLVVKATGDWTVYTNGISAWTGTGSGLTSLVPGADYQGNVWIGRNNKYDGWNVFNGLIGDVFVYTNALSTADRGILETNLATKFNIALPTPPPPPPAYNWAGSPAGDMLWDTAANWDNNVPTSSAVAVLSDMGSSATIIAGGFEDLGGLEFNNNVPNTVINASGGGQFYFYNNDGVTASHITADAGSLTINAPITAVLDAVFDGPGTVTLTGDNYFGGNTDVGVSTLGLWLKGGGTLNLTSGTTTVADLSGITVDQNATLAVSGTLTTADHDEIIADSDTHGQVVLSGTGSWTHTGGGVFVVGNDQPACLGTVTINDSAVLDLSGATGTGLNIGVGWGGGSNGKVVQNGGTLKTITIGTAWNGGAVSPGVVMGCWYSQDNCNAEYDLNGGTLITPNIYNVYSTSGVLVPPPASTAVFRFNGGVLQGTQNDNLGDPQVVAEGSTNLMGNLTHAYVGNNGAKIDTAGFTCGINQALEHDPSASAIDGGLTKMSAGTLTLYKASTYTGPTVVQAGVLSCANSPSSMAPTALTIATGATVNLAYTGNQNIPGLTIGVTVQTPGVYGSGALNPGLVFTGPGTVTVVAALPPAPVLPPGGFTMPGGSPTFQWHTVAGYHYRVVYSDTVNTPLASWLPVINAGAGFPGPNGWSSALSTGADMTVSDPSPSLTHRFYRIEAQ